MNPGGIATYGYVVFANGEMIYQESGIVGEGTDMSNNVAEYSGLCAALRWLKERKLQQCGIVIFSDSRLLVNQMNGLWKTHEGLYLRWHQEAQRLAQGFPRLRFQWVPREQNMQADVLSREAYTRYSESKIVGTTGSGPRRAE
jgi:ribonuclease HI